jgi:hypothetical protein
MTRSEAYGNRLTKLAARLILAAVTTGTMIAAAIYGYGRVLSSLTQNAVSSPAETVPQPSWSKIETPVVVQPSTVPAASAGLGEDEEVIGGRSRAYSLKALRNPRFHIVNDLIGGVPVSVTYCDLTDCTQVYTGPGDAPLQIAQAGLLDRGMVIRIGGVYYEHRTGRAIEPSASAPPLPYEPSPWTRTTWGEWKRRHPATDVYRGGAGRESIANGR